MKKAVKDFWSEWRKSYIFRTFSSSALSSVGVAFVELVETNVLYKSCTSTSSVYAINVPRN